MKNKTIIFILFILYVAPIFPQYIDSTFTEREDGRFMSTYGYVLSVLERTKPKLAYNPQMTLKEFQEWKEKVRNAMLKLMNFPKATNQPSPVRISSEPRKGYVLEKWEFYPLPGCVSTFLVLKPEKLVDKQPAILCIPGAGRTKEGLAGEPGIFNEYTEDITSEHVTMALDYVKAGYIAIAVDNAGAGEAADIEHYKMGSNYNYDIISRILLELGWSWLGYTSFLDMQVLQWMKSQDYIDAKHIIVSGFSLGTEPLMVLGVLDKDIFAFVYNDFLCNTQERAIVVTKPQKEGYRTFPNSIRHLIPSYWKYFNFPDVVASLAPRPIIFTEGGLDRDFNLVKDAYKKNNAADNIECHHYPKYAKESSRLKINKLPKGLDTSTYLQKVNVDPDNHYFKSELVIPWINKIIMKSK